MTSTERRNAIRAEERPRKKRRGQTSCQWLKIPNGFRYPFGGNDWFRKGRLLWVPNDFENKAIQRQPATDRDLEPSEIDLETYGGETQEWKASQLQYGEIMQSIAKRLSLGIGFWELRERESGRYERRSENNAKYETKKKRRCEQPATLYSRRRRGGDSDKCKLGSQDQALVQEQPETPNDHEMVELQNEVSGNLQSGGPGDSERRRGRGCWDTARYGNADFSHGGCNALLMLRME